MNLNEVKLNTNYIVRAVNIKNRKTQIRLMELGLVNGAVVQVNKKSIFKKTLLIILNSCCFTLKDNIASDIVVEYA